jgi:hypothetical protein
MTIRTYRTYRFVNKDPMIDKLRTALQREFPRAGRQGEIDYKAVSLKSGVNRSTYRGWFEKDVRRPQGATIIATARTMPGYDVDLLTPDELEAVMRIRKRRDR